MAQREHSLGATPEPAAKPREVVRSRPSRGLLVAVAVAVLGAGALYVVEVVDEAIEQAARFAGP